MADTREKIMGFAAAAIEGPKGVAKLLDMKPSTARYRMKKLEIRKIDYVD